MPIVGYPGGWLTRGTGNEEFGSYAYIAGP
jgi:hypothetical protein